MRRTGSKLLLILLLTAFALPLQSFREQMLEIVNAIRIFDIKFHNIYPFFSNELLDQMTLYPGSIYDEEEVSKQQILLKEYLTGMGYGEVKIEIDTDKVTERLVKLHVKLIKGGYYALGRIDIEGNKSFSSIRLKKELNSYWRSFLFGESGRFIPDKYESDIRKLRDFYREKGFTEVEVTGNITKDDNSGKADINFRINEGPRYEVVLSGNRFFRAGAFSEETGLIFRGRRATVAARQMTRGIIRKYRDEGFNEVKVEWSDSVYVCGKKKCGRIDIIIEEGPRTKIKEIEFSGNRSFGDKQLSLYVNSIVRRWYRFSEFFDKNMWEDDERNLTAFYNRNGFLSASVKGSYRETEDRTGVSIFFDINEGQRTLIDSVVFRGGDQFKNELNEVSRRIHGMPFNMGFINERRDHVKGFLASKGYIYADVVSKTELSPDSSSASVMFGIELNDIAATGKIFMAGNLKTRDRTVKKLMPLNENEPFSILDMSRGLRNLRNQRIFRSVSASTPGIDAGKDTIDVLIRLEEYPPYFFQAAGGYESYTGPYLSMFTGNRNLFGMNKEISFRAEASFIKQSANMSFLEPVLFTAGLAGSVSVYWENTDDAGIGFKTAVMGAGAGMSYRWENRLQSSVGAHIENRKLTEKSYSGSDSVTVRNTGRLRMSNIWDGRDSFMLPRNGIYGSIETELSTGIDNRDDDFIKYRLELKYFRTPAERLTFAVFGRLDHLQVMDKKYQPPVDQLFYLGGTGTVRGIGSNLFLKNSEGDPAGAKTAAVLAFETRMEFWKNWETPVFFDTGYMTESDHTDGLLRTTAGTGLRYVTPIGAMGILYGYPLDIRRGYKKGVFHFSLGYTF